MGIKDRVIELSEEYREDLVNFLLDMIRIPSQSGKEEKLALRIKKEMEEANFDEVFIDKLGNVIGRIGNGSKIIAYDGHMDTVDIGDRELWRIDPFEGIISDDSIYGRGAADQKGGIASMVYGGKILKKLGLEDGYTLYIIASIMKEECDGLAWRFIINEDNIRPDFLVITEPTNLNIYRGHRGKTQLKVTVKGLSCDASSPQRGMNAIYKSIPIIEELEELNKNYVENVSFGKPSVAVTELFFKTPSSCSIPDECIINIDRRMVQGESIEGVLNEIKSLRGAENSKVEVTICDKPSYTGIIYPCKNQSPPWLLDENHVFVKAASETYKKMFEREPKIDKWTISTNGGVTAGIYNIPTIGFGPGNEMFAHGPREEISAYHLVEACKFYAMFPKRLTKWNS